MQNVALSRIPQHVGLIPDGNRRWAVEHGMARRDGYAAGVEPGLQLLELCRDLGIAEASVYGFTKDNVRRARDQVDAFRTACVEFGIAAVESGAALLVLGDTESAVFPDELRPFAAARSDGDIRINMLVNYGWQWDLAGLSAGRTPPVPASPASPPSAAPIFPGIASAMVPRIDLVVRWGGRSRLSGFLPVQCAYADIFVVDSLWPDMQPEAFLEALEWYQTQDVTLGG